MDFEEKLEYINRSSYRVKIVKSIGDDVKMPRNICKETGIGSIPVSSVLRLLGENGIVECINPDVRKGRLYRLTEDALKILDKVEFNPTTKKKQTKKIKKQKSS